jgi:hypothetical protein
MSQHHLTTEVRPTAFHHRSDWAIASLVLGAVFAVAAPPTGSLLLALDLSQWSTLHPRNTCALLGYAGGGGALCLCLAAVVFGVAGTVSGARRGGSIALGLAGLLLGAFDVLIWSAILASWHAQALHRT